MPEYVLGIDLGTSNSVVAAVRDGQPEVLRDSEGRAIQPSVVSFHPTGSILVGHEAKSRRLLDPKNTVLSAKRLIGRPFPDESVQEYLARVPFRAVEGENQEIVIEARDQRMTVPEISAFVLHHLKVIAERSLRKIVKKAVITVPANFNDAQRAATLAAGEAAGLEVLRILNEPTAAALAYGYGKDLDRRVLIYDFGGGTFDVTILDIRGDVYEVRATAGDSYLGGDDIDDRVVEAMAAEFLKKHRYDLRENEASYERLRQAAEELKCALSFQPQASVDVEEIAPGKGGKTLDFHFALERKGFERLVEEIVDHTFVICDEAFRLAGMRANAVDEVVLVGGSTRVPLVRASVQSYFARTPLATINPDEVVSLGAALQGAALLGDAPVVAARAEPRAPEGAVPGPGGPVPKKTTFGMPAAPPLPPERTPPLPPERTPPPVPVGRTPPPVPVGRTPPPVPGAVIPPPIPGLGLPAVPPPATVGLSTSEFDFAEDDGAPGIDLELEVVGPDGSIDEYALDEPLPDLPSLSVPGGVAAPSPPEITLAPAAPAPEITFAPPAPAVPAPAVRRPLLLDVTPLSLGVATVGGYGQVVIPRNSPVPVEASKVYVTSEDDQTEVVIRICQGESRRFEENTVLGELRLEGLPAAPRGEVQVRVTFEIDTNGILQASAADQRTGQVQRSTIELRGQARRPQKEARISGDEGAYRVERGPGEGSGEAP